MSREEAVYQSVGSAGATLVAFIGVIHEYAGHLIFPWAPAAVGGPAAWHALGVLAILAGVTLLAGTLRVIEVPVLIISLMVAAIAVLLVVMTGIVYREFHLIALAAFFASCATGFSHRRVLQISSQEGGA